jgi:hypothetical protein
MNAERLLVDKLEGFTRAILRPAGPEVVEFVGSASLLNLAGRLYLLTAGHVLDQADDSTPLFLGASDRMLPIVGNASTSHTAHLKHRTDDRLDLAVVALPTEYIAHFSDDEILSFANVDTKAEAVAERGFVFMGYPESKNRRPLRGGGLVIVPSLYSAICHEAPPKVYHELGAPSSDHLLLAFDAKRMVSSQGVRRIAPALNGLSGAPVWGSTSANVGVVVAVLTEHHKAARKCVVSTRISCFLEALQILRSSEVAR